MLKAKVGLALQQDAEVPLARQPVVRPSVRNVNAKIYYIVVLRREGGIRRGVMSGRVAFHIYDVRKVFGFFDTLFTQNHGTSLPRVCFFDYPLPPRVTVSYKEAPSEGGRQNDGDYRALTLFELAPHAGPHACV